MKIVTTYVNPPIPIRSFDWQALWVDHEEYCAGWGATEEAAIKDLKQRYEDKQ